MTADFLQFDHVSKSFQADRKSSMLVLDDISLQVKAGEFVVFLGPSGCGKTTLMRMVGGLEHPTKGQIFLEGDRITRTSRRQGMVFQSYSSFPWLTVYENVLFGMRYRRGLSRAAKQHRALFYLDLMGLNDVRNYYITQISGGMQQRVALARTLAADPDILLMDEPFGALDAQTREFLQYQLLNICQTEKKTVIFVTHDVEEAVFLGDRILIFSARPAHIIEDIQVSEFLLEDRTLATKESDAFFQLRNHILDIVRVQAQQAERPTHHSIPPKRSPQ
ncbi:MAG: ABC transporter ATP-binding protein [Elainellaceae cyanobacterium]